MQNSPAGQGGKGAATGAAPQQQGKAGATPTAPTGGKGQAPAQAPAAGKTGAGSQQGSGQAGTQTQQAQAPGLAQLFSQAVQGGGGSPTPAPSGNVSAGSQTPGSSMGKPGHPVYSPMGQAHHGSSSSNKNPNEGGMNSSGQSAMTNPSTTQGGMGG